MGFIMKKVLIGITLAVAGSVWFGNANAVPSFARAHDKKCSYCHNAYPQLNQKGRAFKEAGYRLKEDLKDTSAKQPVTMEDFPISGMLVSRPYDKKSNGEAKIRAIHEVELFIAGAMNKNWSGFLEIEAEDETGFEPEIGPVVLAYRLNNAVNFQASWANAMWTDPYGLYGDHFRMTRGHVAVIDVPYGGAEGSLRSNRQQVVVTGRPIKKLFYSVGYGGEADDFEGEDSRNATARIAFDITDNIMIGGFAMNGNTKTTVDAPEFDFSRYGLDFQGDFAGARVQVAYVNGKDDTSSDGTAVDGSETNSSAALQALYTFKTKSGKPTWVPVARYDMYEENDGKDDYGVLSLNLTYYLMENVKGYIEYADAVNTPDGVDGNSRVTFQVYVGL